MAKPTAFWKARALPTISGGQARADRAEKWGESAITVAPQSSSRAVLAQSGQAAPNGYSAQHRADRASAMAATRALPIRWLHQPPARQPKVPMPIMAKAKPDCAGLPGAARPL